MRLTGNSLISDVPIEFNKMVCKLVELQEDIKHLRDLVDIQSKKISDMQEIVDTLTKLEDVE